MLKILIILFISIVAGYYIYDENDWRCVKTERNPDGGYSRWLYMRLADHTDGVKPNDLWFDRLVYVHHEGKYDLVNNIKPESIEDLSVTLNGAIFTERLVLTSLNPFRNVIRFRFKRFYTSVCALRRRRYATMATNKPYYNIEAYRVVCARPVIPIRDPEVAIDLWHGYKGNEKLHSPIHDLIVFRVEMNLTGLIKNNNYRSTENWRNVGGFLEVGPILSYLATKNDTLGRDLKFGMLGDNLSKKMIVRRNIYTRTFEPEENVVTNCDAWFPREWGWFICLRNVDNLKRLASGAMLYSKEKLFGVGSFLLFKGNLSILVFTDVRRYTDLIYNTCTEEDQDFKTPVNRTDL